MEKRRPPGGERVGWGGGCGEEKAAGGGGGGGGVRRDRRRGGGEEIADTATATTESDCDGPRLAHHLFSSLLYFRFLRFPQICKFGVWNWFPRV